MITEKDLTDAWNDLKNAVDSHYALETIIKLSKRYNYLCELYLID